MGIEEFFARVRVEARDDRLPVSGRPAAQASSVAFIEAASACISRRDDGDREAFLKSNPRPSRRRPGDRFAWPVRAIL